MSLRPPHIVIAGAGFGGLYTFRYLSHFLKRGEATITIIDKNDSFLFTPLLHEVATASIGEEHVSENIDKLVARNKGNFLVAEINSIDFVKNQIFTTSGSVKFDYLVLALGASAISQESSGGYCLKTLQDAIKIKKHINNVFKNTAEEKDPAQKRKLLRFVIVGGGPTGVELAAEVSEMTNELKRSYENKLSGIKLEHVLVHGSDRLLPNLPDKFGVWAKEILDKNGWQILLGNRVVGCDKNVLRLNGGSVIEASTIIWTIGVESNSKKFNGLPILPNGRIEVDENLKMKGSNNVFAIGDNASGVGNSEWPMLAQAAVQNAKIVAKNIVATINDAPLKKFRYRSKGVLISLGRWQAIGQIERTFVRGPLVWLLWQAVYLFKFISWRKRLAILVDWIMNVFRPRNVNIK